MSDDPRRNDDALGERLGRVLRRPEQFGDTFEQDLVAAIRADRPGERDLAPRRRHFGDLGAWWRTSVTVQFSPLAALAVAASLVVVATLGVLSVGPSQRPAPGVAHVIHDTVHVVRFVFVGDAKTVSLVGDFNAWESTPLVATGAKGAWTVSVSLPPGRYEYAFIVDGKQWVADPYAPVTSDEFNTNSSIVTVGT